MNDVRRITSLMIPLAALSPATVIDGMDCCRKLAANAAKGDTPVPKYHSFPAIRRTSRISVAESFSSTCFRRGGDILNRSNSVR